MTSTAPTERRPRCALRRGALLLALAALPGAGCGEQVPRNLVLIVVDTLRADRLGCYGAERETSPAIDALARESVRFERAYATAPWTKPSVASILSGLLPARHGARGILTVLPDRVDTLAEILSRHGFATAGIVSHSILAEKMGFAQGYTSYDSHHARGHAFASTRGVTQRASAKLESLSARDRRFFLFVHYFDHHYDYLRHPEIGFAQARAGRLDGTQSIQRLRAMRHDLSPEELAHLRDRYDEEIRYTDAGVGELLERLRALGRDRDTLVVFTADHGEEFLEHGWIGHTRTLYEELIRVPLLIRGPDLEPGRVSRPVSLASLTPTLLDLLGLDRDSFEFDAPSLAERVRGGRGGDEGSAYAEVAFWGIHPEARERSAFKKALVGPRYKLIRDEQRDAYELYDLSRDAGERRNLAPQRPALVAELSRRLDERARGRGPAAESAPRIELSEAEREELRALGYLD